MPSARDLIVCAVFVAVGVWFLTLWTHATGGVAGFDVYQYWLPNMLYGLQRIGAGGGGLLWNPFQNCGQPSFGISSTGLLYPLNLLFLGLDPGRAMRVQLVGNFAIAGAGMYWLVRELGAGRAAALCGALAFELGAATVDINMWTLQVSDAYVWMPVTVLFCERLLRVPSLANTIGLGGSIAVSLLSGSPQIVFFTYQLLALRAVFEYTTVRPSPRWPTLAALVCGLALGPLLDAVQLLPGVQTAMNSVRSGTLDPLEMRSEVSLNVDRFRDLLAHRSDVFNPVILIPFALASASWLRASTRRRAAFYTGAAALYFVLAFGPATPLFGLYLKLPFGTLFREPIRFSWVPSFCLAVLSGLGADAILRRPPAAVRRRAVGGVVCIAVAVAVFYGLAPNLRASEWTLVGTLIGAVLLAARGGRARRIAAVLVIVATAANLLTYGARGLPDAFNAVATRELSIRRLLPDETIYSKYADVFTDVRTRMTPQDRVFILHSLMNYALAPKTASLFQVPSIDDYEPQPSLRWAEYLVTLRSGAEMTSLNQYYYPGLDHFAAGFRKPLLDLAAVRYVIVDASVENGVGAVTPPLYPLAVASDLQVVVYENQQALPRAFYVPRVLVEPDPRRLLRRLAAGGDDPRAVALIETPPPSGFVGVDDAAAHGSAELVVDEPERVVVDVQASARGFLQLADQYAAGWTATVNGAPAPILRANHAFRAVEVPAGQSIVEFRYAPVSFRVGGAITAATLVGLAILVMLRRRRAGKPPRS